MLSLECLVGEGRFAVTLDVPHLDLDDHQVPVVYKPRWWPAAHSTWELQWQPDSDRATLRLTQSGADSFLAFLLHDPEELTLTCVERTYRFQLIGFRAAAARLPCLKRLLDDPRSAWLWRRGHI